jgi:hypothetical protein
MSLEEEGLKENKKSTDLQKELKWLQCHGGSRLYSENDAHEGEKDEFEGIAVGGRLTRGRARTEVNRNGKVNGKGKEGVMVQVSSGDEDAEDDEDDERNDSKGEEKKPPLLVQGLCDVVIVRIDNSRPTEEQFDEGDFLDEEKSGDEDWNGDDMEPMQDAYAW